jgi:RNA polymerase sigma-70 factor, ECF subfamily
MNQIRPDSDGTARLLNQIEAGDRSAFDRLFTRHRSVLNRVVATRLDRRLRRRMDRSDVVQETQLAVFRRLPDYLSRRPMPFRLWLRKTAQELILVARRRHVAAGRRTVRREQPLPDRSALLLTRPFFSIASTPSRQLAKQELAQKVRQAVALLSDSDREILLLRAYEGLSNQETAYVLGLDPATASKRHGRAVRRLHGCLAACGLTEPER